MGINLTKEQLANGEYYTEYLEETGAYHIFHTESDFSPYCYGSEEEAESRANEMNKELSDNEEDYATLEYVRFLKISDM